MAALLSGWLAGWLCLSLYCRLSLSFFARVFFCLWLVVSHFFIWMYSVSIVGYSGETNVEFSVVPQYKRVQIRASCHERPLELKEEIVCASHIR